MFYGRFQKTRCSGIGASTFSQEGGGTWSGRCPTPGRSGGGGGIEVARGSVCDQPAACATPSSDANCAGVSARGARRVVLQALIIWGEFSSVCRARRSERRSRVLRENLPAPKRAGNRSREPAATNQTLEFACLPEPDALLRLPALENDSRFQEPPPVAALLLVLSCNADDVGG